ncbi:sigma-54-dependent Fis family transcriptional regulator [bacterium]|nr:sigma-54-dependent Fis family transcriptional regulator [bacterium]
MKKIRIIVLDDSDTSEFISHSLMFLGQYIVEHASNGEDCLKKLEETPFDLVLLNVHMPDINGIDILEKIRSSFSFLPVVIITSSKRIKESFKTKKHIPHGILLKPFTKNNIRDCIDAAIKTCKTQTDARSPHIDNYNIFHFDTIIGQSPVMQKLFKRIEKLIKSDITILIQGESGTGKELFSRAIHNHNPIRKGKPFIVVNCTALPESLLETELFGHEKGAFTGAVSERIGKFELANEGTIFLDEIGEMSLSTQAKILRALQEREIQRIGSNKTVQINIRLISATHKDLEKEVAAGRFREDLFYRLNVFQIKIPALRQRVEDIPLLAINFLNRYARRENKIIDEITPEAMHALSVYNWPGNIRELENVIERAVVISNESQISRKDLSSDIQGIDEHRSKTKDEHDPDQETLPAYLEKIEIAILQRTMLELNGNVAKVARRLGIGRATIYRKAKKHNLPISR